MDCDVLIIGGGIAGISAAAAVSPFARVILVEAEPALAYHSSARSAALYEPHYGLPPVVALSLAGGEELRAEGVLSPRGLLMVGRAQDEEIFRREARDMAMDVISPGEACAIVPILRPDAVAFAARADHAWDVDTDRLIQSFLRKARGAGAEVRARSAVTALAREGAVWRAETPAGAITARIVVNAAGAWADRVAGMAGVLTMGLRPMRRSVARIPAPAGHDVAGWPMIFGSGEAWYAKPDAGALIVSPAEEDPAEPHDAFADDMVLAEGLARSEAMVTAPVTRMLANWAGLRTFAPDRVPVIGFDPSAPGFFWLAGQGGYGFQTAPAAAALTADLIAGRTPALDPATVSSLSPARFGR